MSSDALHAPKLQIQHTYDYTCTAKTACIYLQIFYQTQKNAIHIIKLQIPYYGIML